MMNIFILAADPKMAAELHTVRDLSSQIKYTAQVLRSALCIYKKKKKEASMQNHFVLWATKDGNMEWLIVFLQQMKTRYELTHNRPHILANEVEDLIKIAGELDAPKRVVYSSFMPTVPYNCLMWVDKVPNVPMKGMLYHKYIDADGEPCIVDVVASYRRYYMLNKISLIHTNLSRNSAWLQIES